MKRIFAAVKIELQPAIHQLFQQLKQHLSADKIKWVEEENLHITLKFFGETPEDKVEAIAVALKQITTQLSFEITFGQLGIFGSSYNPRVVWLGIEDGGNLSKLSERIKEIVVPLGFPNDRQNFVPHLTLGRINALTDKTHFQRVIDRYRTNPFEKQEIDKFILYESILTPSGPQYIIIETYKCYPF